MSENVNIQLVDQKRKVLDELQRRFNDIKRKCPCHFRLCAIRCCNGMHAWEDETVFVDYDYVDAALSDGISKQSYWETRYNERFCPEKVLFHKS